MLGRLNGLRYLALSLFVLIGLSGAWAQSSYPNKPVRLMVGFAPGGGTDFTARLLATKMGAQLGQPVVVDNRPGAAGSIAADQVAKSEPDGYRLLMTASGTFIHSVLSTPTVYNLEREFTPIAMVSVAPLVVLVNPSIQARNIAELIELARSKPGQMTFGSDGVVGVPRILQVSSST